jgi:hypothetical protein
MSLLSTIRDHFRSDAHDDSVIASCDAIEESKQARMQMVEQTKQVRHDAFQMSVDQQRIRSSILNQVIVRKAGPDFLTDALTNKEGQP